jgi:hypothetical protein
MPKINANFAVRPANIEFGQTANPNYGMRGMQIQKQTADIYAQNGAQTGKMIERAGQFGMDQVIQNRDAQDVTDSSAARQIVLDQEQRMQEEMRSVNNPYDIREITKRYDEETRSMLKDKNADGIPYFRNEQGRKAFETGYLNDRVANWHRGGSETAFQLDRRNSAAKIEYSNTQMLNGNLDNPNLEADLNENIQSMAVLGRTPAEIAITKQKTFEELDIRRAVFHGDGLEQRMIDRVKTTGYKPEEVEAEIENYKRYVSDLKNISPELKNKYMEQADRSAKIAESTARAIDIDAKRQRQELELKTYDDLLEKRLNGMTTEESINYVRENSKSLPRSVIEGYANAVERQQFEETRKHKLETDYLEEMRHSQMNEAFDAGIAEIQKSDTKKELDKFNAELRNKSLVLYDASLSYRSEDDINGQNYFILMEQATNLKALKAPNADIIIDALKAQNPIAPNEEKKYWLNTGKDLIETTLNLKVVTGDKNRNEASVNEDHDGLSYHERLHLQHEIMRPYQKLINENKYTEAEAYIKTKKAWLDEKITTRKLKSAYYSSRENLVETKNKQIPQYR